MSKTFHSFLIILLILITSKGFAQDEVCYNPNLVKDTTKKSIKSMAISTLNGDTIKVKYHSPGVRKRIIWGGLVPFGEVWVTGAHDATAIEFNKPVIFGDKEIPAGRYAFFTIPGKKEWTLILNKNWEQHLASEYDEKDDIARVHVKPKKNDHTERLQYFLEQKKELRKLVMAWEKIKIEVPLYFKN